MSQRSGNTSRFVQREYEWCDLESGESLAVVAVPNGILLPSVILGKSAKSWRIIAKNSSDRETAPSHCLCCSCILRLILLHLNLGNPEARDSVTNPLLSLNALPQYTQPSTPQPHTYTTHTNTHLTTHTTCIPLTTHIQRNREM